ncbi:WXG100 family type VII secretion target [Tumebacillus sp. DT12]|uniref:WXG100 family type VII secretion target n=1 Tax=Tumebacillus lacus TaxID=2995335 RepID=A0ABT3X2J5_9BACL|nr:WXG100 family type VII secretion target [Tumebacillus lacus]MCX7571130.1 WXG100 family type VII secretion target [Tumebacillus lacus]
MNYANTLLIRSGATRFAAAGQEISGQEKKLASIIESLDAGSNGWRGEGARAFYAETEKHRADFRLASQAFVLVAQALNTLANQLDTVNQMRRQLENLQHESSILQRRLLHAEDEDRSYYNQEIGLLNVRITQLRFEADSLERNANLVAGRQFDDAADMAERLHSFYEKGFEVDIWAPIVGTSKVIGNAGAAMDGKDIFNRWKQGYTYDRLKRADGYDILVQNGRIANIRDGVYHSVDASKYPDLFKYFDMKIALKDALLNPKSITMWLGYASVAYETYDHWNENIEDEKSGSYIAAEVTVDLSIGIGTIAASAIATSTFGAKIGAGGGPWGAVAGAGVGIVVGLVSSLVLDGISVNGKTLNEHIKEDVATAIDTTAEWFDDKTDDLHDQWTLATGTAAAWVDSKVSNAIAWAAGPYAGWFNRK